MTRFAALALTALALSLALPAVSANALTLGAAGNDLRKPGDVVTVADGCGRFRHWSWRLRRCVWN